EQIAKKKKNKEDASEDIAQMKEVGQKIGEMDNDLRSVKEALDYHLLRVPNLPDEDVPVGPDEDSNVTIKEWGKVEKPGFEPKAHWDLGEKLDIIDLAAGAKVTGSGFYILKGAGARLQRALISFMLDTHAQDGFIEITAPVMAGTAAMTGTGQLPKLGDDMYFLKEDGLYLIPTGEVPITNLHSGEILSEDQLPKYYMAATNCFRREAGAAGKDNRGLLRVHQFDKVEMVKIVNPDKSAEEHETLLAQAEKIVEALNIPYRVKLLATGDLSFAAAKCYDIEIWSAGVGKFLEISSVSNFLDFQARRMNTRFRDNDNKLRFVHTLNGSGLALPRLIAALLENYQTDYGTVVIPEVLRPYMGGLTEISKK
ncbi:MAG: serine--tRNA ligase, partial [candidate division Zixibacteria bacterium]|nr:serine--tRNA ligase [candidate division Zixibacteria bacterium]